MIFSGGIEWRRSGVFILTSEHISHLVQVFLLLTLRLGKMSLIKVIMVSWY